MPHYLVSYDVRATTPSPYNEFREQLADRGFYIWLNHAPRKYPHLPNTTAKGMFENIASARAAFEAARREAATAIGGVVDVEKFVIVEFTEFYIESNANSDD